MPDFLILGLPRSRTAWLSNFMTDKGLFCYHDAIEGCRNMDDYLTKTKGCGDADTALAFFKYQNYFENVPTVIIDSFIDSSVNFGFKNGKNVTKSMVVEQSLLDSIDGLHVKFEDINDNLENIWNHLTDKEFDKKRAEMLVKLDIQVINIDVDSDALIEFMEAVDGYLV